MNLKDYLLNGRKNDLKNIFLSTGLQSGVSVLFKKGSIIVWTLKSVYESVSEPYLHSTVNQIMYKWGQFKIINNSNPRSKEEQRSIPEQGV